MSWEAISINRIVRCRWARPCVWCGQTIDLGKSYVSQAGKFDGDFQRNSYHPECFKAMAADPYSLDGFTAGENPRPEAP